MANKPESEWRYKADEIESMTREEMLYLAIHNLFSTEIEKCPKCGMYIERNYICWNCGYDGD